MSISPTQTIALCLGVVLTMGLAATPAKADEPVERNFNEASWSDGLVDVRPDDLANSKPIPSGFDGSGLEVNIPPGNFRGVGSFERLPEQPTEAWYRYHIQLVSFESRSSGKLPGLSGLYSNTARGCLPSKSGSPGWSARGLFGAAGSHGAPKGEVPIGLYLYHLDQPGMCGEALYWADATLKPGRWHCIEGHVKLNTPGSADGAATGWLDGVRRFSREGLSFRRANEEGVGIREMWLDVYYGGRKPTPNSLQLVIDEVAVSTTGRVGCLDSLTNLVGSFGGDGRDVIATYHPDDGGWSMNRGIESSLETESMISYRTTSDWAAHLAGDFDGDGRHDVASYHPSNGTWWMSRSRASGFETKKWAEFNTAAGWGSHLVGDFTGDGMDDVASYHLPNGSWWVSSSKVVDLHLRVRCPSQEHWLAGRMVEIGGWSEFDITACSGSSALAQRVGEGSVTRLWGSFTTTRGWASQLAGDFDGDGVDDIASYHPGSGTWWVSVSRGDGFVTTKWDSFSTGTGWTTQLAGDFDGDGVDDIANYHASSGTWWVSSSTGSTFSTRIWASA